MVRVLIRLLAGSVVLSALAAKPVFAISADLAKKCRELSIKAHPPKPAGTKDDKSRQAQREYFRVCVEKNGNV
jgi:hypothetical protein